MQQKEMFKVSQEINTLDGQIEKEICKAENIYRRSTNAEELKGKCGTGTGSSVSNSSTATGLNNLWEAGSSAKAGGFYDKTAAKEMGEHTSATISDDIRQLNSEQKGIVSSAFAKAHEGAEIVEIRSISTTSVMVNACYDVLAEGIKQLTKKNMHDVSKAINILDDKIDTKICKTGDWVNGNGSKAGEAADGKCSSGGKASNIGYTKLSDMGTGDTTGSSGSNHKRSYPEDAAEKMEKYTSCKISKDVSTNLNKDQKGVVSSVFAKAATSSNNTDTARYTSLMYI